MGQLEINPSIAGKRNMSVSYTGLTLFFRLHSRVVPRRHSNKLRPLSFSEERGLVLKEASSNVLASFLIWCSVSLGSLEKSCHSCVLHVQVLCDLDTTHGDIVVISFGVAVAVAIEVVQMRPLVELRELMSRP